MPCALQEWEQVKEAQKYLSDAGDNSKFAELNNLSGNGIEKISYDESKKELEIKLNSSSNSNKIQLNNLTDEVRNIILSSLKVAVNPLDTQNEVYKDEMYTDESGNKVSMHKYFLDVKDGDIIDGKTVTVNTENMDIDFTVKDGISINKGNLLEKGKSQIGQGNSILYNYGELYKQNGTIAYNYGVIKPNNAGQGGSFVYNYGLLYTEQVAGKKV